MTDRYDAVVLVGRPGAGKTTLGKMIDALPRYVHFSTGNLIRSLDQDTELGRRTKKLIDDGRFIPDDDMDALSQDYLGKHVKEGEFVIYDGIPRNMAQVGDIAEYTRVRRVIVLDASKETCLERLLGRAEEEGRADDTKGKISRRLKEFDRSTGPVIKAYESADDQLVKIVNAEQHPVDVARTVLQYLPRRD